MAKEKSNTKLKVGEELVSKEGSAAKKPPVKRERKSSR